MKTKLVHFSPFIHINYVIDNRNNNFIIKIGQFSFSLLYYAEETNAMDAIEVIQIKGKWHINKICTKQQLLQQQP